MSCLPFSLPCKNTPLRCSPLTPKSPRRSSNRRIHNPSGCSPQTGRIRHNTYNSYTRPTNQRTGLPLYCFGLMRYHYNRIYLPTSNRPEITNRILFSRPHRISRGGYFNSNTLRIYWCNYSHNRTRPCLLSAILLSQYQLRTHPQPNHTTCPRNTNNSPLNNHLVICSQFSKSGPPPSPQPNRRTNNHHFYI